MAEGVAWHRRRSAMAYTPRVIVYIVYGCQPQEPFVNHSACRHRSPVCDRSSSRNDSSFPMSDTVPAYDMLSLPTDGEPVRMAAGRLEVPSRPIIPFIEGDGIGPDIWRAASAVFEAAVEKAYGGERRIAWFEVLAGQKAFDRTGDWLPRDTLRAIRHHLVAIKGPLTTPVGGGIRSLNVALRQQLDLFACVRPRPLVRGRSVSRARTGPCRHDDLPGEHRRHLRRHRVGGGERGSAPPARVPVRRDGRLDDPFPRDQFVRREADLARRDAATRPGGDPLRQGPGVRERHPRPQGEHHEVHRGRIPRLGLRTREGRIRGAGVRRRPLVPDLGTGSSSRT